MTENSDQKKLQLLNELRSTRRKQLKNNALNLRENLRPQNLLQRAQTSAELAIESLTEDAIATAKTKPLAAITVGAMLAGAALFYPLQIIIEKSRFFEPDLADANSEDMTGDNNE